MGTPIKCKAKISNQVREEKQGTVIKEKMKKCHQLMESESIQSALYWWDTA